MGDLYCRYNCLCFITMFAWILLYRAAFCGNNFVDVGTILRIIGEFKKNIWKKIIGEFKSLSLCTVTVNFITKLCLHTNV